MTAPVVPPTAPAAPVVPPADVPPADVAPVEPPAPKMFDEAYVKTLRDSEAAMRIKARDAETAAQAAADARIKAILKAAGVDTGAEDPVKAAEQAAKERDDARATVRTLTVERALAKAAGKHGADEDLLTAVLSHQGKIAALDPSAEDFNTALDALVKEAVEGNPKLKAARAAGKSGADFSGGTGETGQITEAQLLAMSPEQIDAARRAGKLAHLL